MPTRVFRSSTPREMLELARQKGAVSYASATTQAYLGMALLASMSGTQMQYIPYKGSAPALNDLLAGVVALKYDTIATATQHIKSGKLKPLAIASLKRSPLMPQVPTVDELGAPRLPGHSLDGHSGACWHRCCSLGCAGAGDASPGRSGRLPAAARR